MAFDPARANTARVRFALLLAFFTTACALPANSDNPEPLLLAVPPADAGSDAPDDPTDPIAPVPQVDVVLAPELETGGAGWIVAHPDDDLLFMNPDIAEAIESGLASTTIVLTAGDAGDDAHYWGKRELGLEAAYAKMAHVEPSVIPLVIRERGKLLHAVAFEQRKDVRLIFVRLPDGGFDPTTGGGAGSPRYRGESLQKLLRGEIRSIHTVDGAHDYSSRELATLLSQLVEQMRLTRVATLEPSSALGFDHSDHHAAAALTLAALRGAHSAPLSSVDAYRGYSLFDSAHHSSIAPNLGVDEIALKRAAFLAYCPFDHIACPPITDYAQWLSRRSARTIRLLRP